MKQKYWYENEPSLRFHRQLSESIDYATWLFDWDKNETDREKQRIESNISKFFVLGYEFNLDLLTQSDGQHIVNVIVYSSCGEVETALTDLVLFSTLISVYRKYIAEEQLESISRNDDYQELSLTSNHTFELWPWDRLFWPWR